MSSADVLLLAVEWCELNDVCQVTVHMQQGTGFHEARIRVVHNMPCMTSPTHYHALAVLSATNIVSCYLFSVLTTIV